MRLEIINNMESALIVDMLRYDIYNFKYNKDNYYVKKIMNREICVIACYIDDKIIGGLYVSNYLKSLYIENIFVSKLYRNKGIAKSMINFAIKNKDYFEEYFDTKIDYSKLEPNSRITIDIYKKIGYSSPNDLNIMKRRI